MMDVASIWVDLLRSTAFYVSIWREEPITGLSDVRGGQSW